METESKSKDEEETKGLPDIWDWASAIAEG
jgi:hypothetical protein